MPSIEAQSFWGKKQHEQITNETARKGVKTIMYKNEVFYKNNEKII